LEWEPTLVVLPFETSAFEDVSFKRNGRALEVAVRKVDGKARVVAAWPRSNPGRYYLEAAGPGLAVEDSVVVLCKKLPPAEFKAFIDDLEHRLPVSIAMGLNRCGGLAGAKLIDPSTNTVEQELARLRLAVLGNAQRPGLAKVLRQVAREPHHVLRTEERWVKAHQARRPIPGRLAQALVRPDNLEGGVPRMVVDARVEPSHDVYENQLLRTYHDVVESRLRRLRRWVRRGSAEGEVEEMIRGLAASRRVASFLDGVRQLRSPPTNLTMVLLRRPAYRSALDGYLEFCRQITIELEAEDMESPLRDLPKLYQIWGTLLVIDALLKVADKLDYVVTEQALVRRRAGSVLVQALRKNRSAVELRHVDGTTVKLIPEPYYGPSNVDGVHSVSFVQEPDVSMEIRWPDGRVEVWLFDPKYKLSGDDSADPKAKPKKVDIDKMHAYRDAIRCGSEQLRTVQYAATMYPGPSMSWGPGLEALSMIPTTVGLLGGELRLILEKALNPNTHAKEARHE